MAKISLIQHYKGYKIHLQDLLLLLSFSNLPSPINIHRNNSTELSIFMVDSHNIEIEKLDYSLIRGIVGFCSDGWSQDIKELLDSKKPIKVFLDDTLGEKFFNAGFRDKTVLDYWIPINKELIAQSGDLNIEFVSGMTGSSWEN